jgi:hypothetical protein
MKVLRASPSKTGGCAIQILQEASVVANFGETWKNK